MNRRTTRPAILRRSGQVGFKDQLRVCGRLLDHVPGDTAQWNLDSALPAGDRLSGTFSDGDVDETSRPCRLGQRAKNVRHAIGTIVLHCHGAVETEVIAPRSLLPNRLATAAATILP